MTTRPIPTSDGGEDVALTRLLLTIFPGARPPEAQRGIHSESVSDILNLLPDGVVYEALKNILAGGDNVTLTEDDDAATITIAGQSGGLETIVFPVWSNGGSYVQGQPVWHSGAVYVASGSVGPSNTGPDVDRSNWISTTTYRDEYDATLYYDEGQVVTDGGEYYIANSSRGPNATLPSADATNWTRISNFSAGETVTALEALTGDNRLNASAIRNLPQPSDGGLASVATDATITGDGTSGDPLAVAAPFTNAAVDARVATWARANGPSGTIPDNRVPASIARDSEIATWARSTGARGTIPNARVPGTIARVNATLALAGGTMTGFLTLSGAPTANLHAATKAYVDAAVAAVAPSTPSAVDFLFATSDSTGISPLTDLPPGGGQSSSNGEVTIAAYSGSRYWFIVRPTADGDITSVRVKGSQIEQIGAFTRSDEPFTYRGTQYRTWRSNHALTNATATTIVVR